MTNFSSQTGAIASKTTHLDTVSAAILPHMGLSSARSLNPVVVFWQSHVRMDFASYRIADKGKAVERGKVNCCCLRRCMQPQVPQDTLCGKLRGSPPWRKVLSRWHPATWSLKMDCKGYLWGGEGCSLPLVPSRARGCRPEGIHF